MFSKGFLVGDVLGDYTGSGYEFKSNPRRIVRSFFAKRQSRPCYSPLLASKTAWDICQGSQCNDDVLGNKHVCDLVKPVLAMVLHTFGDRTERPQTMVSGKRYCTSFSGVGSSLSVSQDINAFAPR